MKGSDIESFHEKMDFVSPVNGVDSIPKYSLADNPDSGDSDTLTKQTQNETLKFLEGC